MIELSSPGMCQIVQSLPLNRYLQWLSEADVTGDGIKDALVATSAFTFGNQTDGTNQVVILRGDGLGGFGNPTVRGFHGAARPG